MDRQKFFAELRRKNNPAFGTSLKQAQVEGVEAILDECERHNTDLGQTAYCLATAHGETGGRFQPVREKMYYSTAKRVAKVFSKSRRQGRSPAELSRAPVLLANTVYGGEWGREYLGNTEPNDGWDFRGAGMGQITGRRNFWKWSQKMGMDFIAKPELLMNTKISAAALVQPMLEGWATGLSLSQFVVGNHRDYRNARKVWNGVFEADKYAQLAKNFERALIAGGWTNREFVRPDEEPLVLERQDRAPMKNVETPAKPKGRVGIVGGVIAGLAASGAAVLSKGCEWFGIFCQ